jgi:hypothetical protein
LTSLKISGKRSPVSHPETLQKEVVIDSEAKGCGSELVDHLGISDTDSQYFSPEEEREMTESAKKVSLFMKEQSKFQKPTLRPPKPVIISQGMRDAEAM